jgi:alpha-1,3-rhamnosyltransferase
LCYNHSRFLDAHFAAIWNQTYPDIEIIALDDGSPDGSAAMLEDLAKKSPRPMTVIQQGNTGNVPGNFNELLRRAKGKYVVIISCDDVLPENAVAPKIKEMEKDDRLAFVASRRFRLIDENGRESAEQNQRELDEAARTADGLLELEYTRFATFYVQSAVFRKEIADAVGGYDEDLFGDDIILRIKIFNHMKQHSRLSFRILDDCGLLYRVHGNNISKQSLRWMHLVLQALDRYFPERPNPPLLKALVQGMIKTATLKEAYALLTMSPRVYAMLDDERFKKALHYCVMKACGKKPLHEYFYHRITRDGVRAVTLFSLFTFRTAKKRLWHHYLYKREKDGDARTITLFSRFKYRYTKSD